MPEYAEPNEITYTTFLKACTNLIPKGPARDSAITAVFRHCCDNGRVGSKVIELIERFLSKEQIEKFSKCKMGTDGTIRQSDLPLEWSRNVNKAVINNTKPMLTQ